MRVAIEVSLTVTEFRKRVSGTVAIACLWAFSFCTYHGIWTIWIAATCILSALASNSIFQTVVANRFSMKHLLLLPSGIGATICVSQICFQGPTELGGARGCLLFVLLSAAASATLASMLSLVARQPEILWTVVSAGCAGLTAAYVICTAETGAHLLTNGQPTAKFWTVERGLFSHLFVTGNWLAALCWGILCSRPRAT